MKLFTILAVLCAVVAGYFAFLNESGMPKYIVYGIEEVRLYNEGTFIVRNFLGGYDIITKADGEIVEQKCFKPGDTVTIGLDHADPDRTVTITKTVLYYYKTL